MGESYWSGLYNSAFESDEEMGDPYDGLDYSSAQNWIYASSGEWRDYQYNMVHKSLFKNTLISLPTGLGKTFIANVVMYNFHKWYPGGKVIFMAHSRPLVKQQAKSLSSFFDIPPSAVVELTGTRTVTLRRDDWESKHIFFITPQILVNDMVRYSFLARQIKCLVVDEAHKALGNHPYCQVVRQLTTAGAHFRVLALTASPGTSVKVIQQIVDNLRISLIELRTDQSLDTREYTHRRQIEKIVVNLAGHPVEAAANRLVGMMHAQASRLYQQSLIRRINPLSVSKFSIFKAREDFRRSSQYSPQFESDFSALISLCHAYELLLVHGFYPFHQFVTSKGIKGIDYQAEMGHPKQNRLLGILRDHFRLSPDSRAIVFSQYRDSVIELSRVVAQVPDVRVCSFMGQKAKGAQKVTQKDQIETMEAFRDGGFNTLVSTCVGEEGIDVGSVDLIVCYDATKSPIRFIQRIGRAGRKRAARVYMLVTEGREEGIYSKCIDSKRAVTEAIVDPSRSLKMHESPRMVPPHITPALVKQTLRPVAASEGVFVGGGDYTQLDGLFSRGCLLVDAECRGRILHFAEGSRNIVWSGEGSTSFMTMGYVVLRNHFVVADSASFRVDRAAKRLRIFSDDDVSDCGDAVAQAMNRITSSPSLFSRPNQSPSEVAPNDICFDITYSPPLESTPVKSYHSLDCVPACLGDSPHGGTQVLMSPFVRGMEYSQMPIQDEYDHDGFVVSSDCSDSPPPRKRRVIVYSSDGEDVIPSQIPQEEVVINPRGPLIYAESNKISKHQDLLGILRFRFNYNVHFCSLHGCQLALSAEAGVVVHRLDLANKITRQLARKVVEGFVRGVERTSHLYERLWVIVETGDTPTRPRGFDRLMATLLSCGVCVLQSSGPQSTAEWVDHLFKLVPSRMVTCVDLDSQNVAKAVGGANVINTPSLITILSRFSLRDVICGDLTIIADLAGVTLERLTALRGFFCYKMMREMTPIG